MTTSRFAFFPIPKEDLTHSVPSCAYNLHRQIKNSLQLQILPSFEFFLLFVCRFPSLSKQFHEYLSNLKCVVCSDLMSYKQMSPELIGQ